ncbi:methionyl-tRNA formyltransferase [Dongia soli]|uniref:Methionyl-tRNA formyltransferase n=1 Tax=Dongia soli TaxID=600628 RepID=A0ABU5E7S0_9PROT|nr:methionyl-tRNA formyltransferase [Dongia soli]MDY0881675.1 methionyl-tRNA formyltransferase [Dongia soli]
MEARSKTDGHKLRIVFMGTPDFAAVALQSLIAAGHNIVAVYSQPPRPAGRGQQLQLSPVHTLAESQRLTVLTPTTLRSPEAVAAFAAHQADVAVVVAYGLLLPQAILDLPRYGCLNIHASLLPRWRGAAPIQRAIAAGDTRSGVSIMQMEAGLDTGPVVLADELPITDKTTAQTLHDSLAEMGARLILDVLERLPKGDLKSVPQPADGVTYAAKLSRADGQLDWRRPAEELERAIRAFTPWPGAVMDFGSEKIKVLAAQVVKLDKPAAVPGAIIDDDLTIACGRDALRPLIVQRPGKRPMSAAEMLRGFQLPPGRLLPLPAAA